MTAKILIFLLVWVCIKHGRNTTAKIINLTPTAQRVTYQYNSSELSCVSEPCSCSVQVIGPEGTTLETTFLDVHIPSNNNIAFVNTIRNEEILSISSISSLIEPIYLYGAQMKITFDRCDANTHLEVEFSYMDELQDTQLRSSGGEFILSSMYPSITIQTANLSSLLNMRAQMNWSITTNSTTWIQVDIIEMKPGINNRICIYDTHDDFGEWICMTDSVSSTTWYSYDVEMKITFHITHPANGFTVKLTLVDNSTWVGETLTLPACNPTVILQETQNIRFVTPFFNQSVKNVKLQCRMIFRSNNLSYPASVQFKHFHFPGEVTVYSVDGFEKLADAEMINVNISKHSGIVSISPKHELYVDVRKESYSGDGSGVMIQAYNILAKSFEPLESFGVALQIDNNLPFATFTSIGYPILPYDINIFWYFTKVIQDSVIEVQFIDFDIGNGDFFVHEDEIDHHIALHTGSTLPDKICSKTENLTILLRTANMAGICCNRGVSFKVAVIDLPDVSTCEPTDGTSHSLSSFSSSASNTVSSTLQTSPNAPTNEATRPLSSSSSFTTSNDDGPTSETTSSLSPSPSIKSSNGVDGGISDRELTKTEIILISSIIPAVLSVVIALLGLLCGQGVCRSKNGNADPGPNPVRRSRTWPFSFRRQAP